MKLLGLASTPIHLLSSHQNSPENSAVSILGFLKASTVHRAQLFPIPPAKPIWRSVKDIVRFLSINPTSQCLLHALTTFYHHSDQTHDKKLKGGPCMSLLRCWLQPMDWEDLVHHCGEGVGAGSSVTARVCSNYFCRLGWLEVKTKQKTEPDNKPPGQPSWPSSPSEALLQKVLQLAPNKYHQLAIKYSVTWAYGNISHFNHNRWFGAQSWRIYSLLGKLSPLTERYWRLPHLMSPHKAHKMWMHLNTIDVHFSSCPAACWVWYRAHTFPFIAVTSHRES